MTQEINKALHLALGRKWHDLTDTYPLDPKGSMHCDTCEEYVTDRNLHINPDYCNDPRLVIEAMRERGSLSDFLFWLSEGESRCRLDVCFLTGRQRELATLALMWLEKEKADER